MPYNNKTCNDFVSQMEAIDLDVEHYRGRNLWEGPAVRIDADSLQDVIRGTDMKLQWDTMGRDQLIVYPVRGGKWIKDEMPNA